MAEGRLSVVGCDIRVGERGYEMAEQRRLLLHYL
jgi:hypothetical protein